MKKLSCFAVALSLGMAGCAIHPLPEDVTGLSTIEIVKQIRCETRSALIHTALDWLERSDDLYTKTLAFEFRNNIRPVQSFHYNLFRGNVRKTLQLFFDTGVAYNYSLEMTETNNAGFGIGLVKRFGDGTGALGLSASANRQRQNLRTFTITDSFSKLVIKIDNNYCKIGLPGPDFSYPITGEIGIRSVIEDFVNLTLFGNLSGPAEKPKGPPTLVDALDFQTTLTASANPSVLFAPIGRALSVADASIGTTAIRRDVHRVIIGLALPETTTTAVATLRNSLVGSLLTARGGPSELVAAEAVNQVLTRQALRPVVNVIP